MKYTKFCTHVVSLRYIYFALGLCCILIAALANSAAPTLAGLKPSNPDYSGILDRADCGFIRGAAIDYSRPDEPINVDIYDGGN